MAAESQSPDLPAAAAPPVQPGNESGSEEADRLVDQVDRLEAQQRAHPQATELLQAGLRAFPQEDRLLVRMARHLWYQAVEAADRLGKDQKLELTRRAIDHAERAVAANPRSPMNYKFLAIALGHQGELAGTKAKIANGHLFKQHVLRALELTPDDPHLQHMLGRWCWNVAQVGYLSRLAAKALYGEVPQSSVPEALGYFRRSRELLPEWPMNLAYLAAALHKAGEPAEARAVARRVLDTPAATEEDREAQRLVRELRL